jgi:predicted nucleotidyltransferase
MDFTPPRHYHQGMRLDTRQQEAARSAVKRHFGANARVWLFGSRARDNRRGGDIDLYVETDPQDALLRAEAETILDLQRSLGDQRNDLVTHVRGRPLRAIDRIARETGVEL